jgi:hypothetical protein
MFLLTGVLLNFIMAHVTLIKLKPRQLEISYQLKCKELVLINLFELMSWLPYASQTYSYTSGLIDFGLLSNYFKNIFFLKKDKNCVLKFSSKIVRNF